MSLYSVCLTPLEPCENVQPFAASRPLTPIAVATRGYCLRLKLHEGVLARLIQVFTAVVNELIKRL